MCALLARLWVVGVCILVSLTACGSDDGEPEVQFPATAEVLSFDTVTFATNSATGGTPDGGTHYGNVESPGE
jgi:hypothetical protein